MLWYGRLLFGERRVLRWWRFRYRGLRLLFDERRVLRWRDFVLHFVGSDDAAVMFTARGWNDGVQVCVMDVCRRSVGVQVRVLGRWMRSGSVV